MTKELRLSIDALLLSLVKRSQSIFRTPSAKEVYALCALSLAASTTGDADSVTQGLLRERESSRQASGDGHSVFAKLAFAKTAKDIEAVLQRHWPDMEL